MVIDSKYIPSFNVFYKTIFKKECDLFKNQTYFLRDYDNLILLGLWLSYFSNNYTVFIDKCTPELNNRIIELLYVINNIFGLNITDIKTSKYYVKLSNNSIIILNCKNDITNSIRGMYIGTIISSRDLINDIKLSSSVMPVIYSSLHFNKCVKLIDVNNNINDLNLDLTAIGAENIKLGLYNTSSGPMLCLTISNEDMEPYKRNICSTFLSCLEIDDIINEFKNSINFKLFKIETLK